MGVECAPLPPHGLGCDHPEGTLGVTSPKPVPPAGLWYPGLIFCGPRSTTLGCWWSCRGSDPCLVRGAQPTQEVVPVKWAQSTPEAVQTCGEGLPVGPSPPRVVLLSTPAAPTLRAGLKHLSPTHISLPAQPSSSTEEHGGAPACLCLGC